MKDPITFQIYNSSEQLPEDWDAIAYGNIFLSRRYLKVLDVSAPANMICLFIGFFMAGKLEGAAISQFLDATLLESFGEGGRCLRRSIRNIVLKNFASHVLFMGNNMLTGNNSFVFSEKINVVNGLEALENAAFSLQKQFLDKKRKVHITVFKDFYDSQLPDFSAAGYDKYYRFTAQPNMIFHVPSAWKSFEDYQKALLKKYRDQYKRARKKAESLEKKKLSLQEIKSNEDRIYQLYSHVARNASFNTFFLAKNHFYALKELLGEDFLLYGYFQDGKLAGFSTLIRNGDTMETYFLGYDDQIQKEKMLYLNMLYDMIAYSINHGFKRIIFARTALEIKSSVGAEPESMSGFMAHTNALINKKAETIFKFVEPQVQWQQRHPFKDQVSQSSYGEAGF